MVIIIGVAPNDAETAVLGNRDRRIGIFPAKRLDTFEFKNFSIKLVSNNKRDSRLEYDNMSNRKTVGRFQRSGVRTWTPLPTPTMEGTKGCLLGTSSPPMKMLSLFPQWKGSFDSSRG